MLIRLLDLRDGIPDDSVGAKEVVIITNQDNWAKFPRLLLNAKLHLQVIYGTHFTAQGVICVVSRPLLSFREEPVLELSARRGLVQLWTIVDRCSLKLA